MLRRVLPLLLVLRAAHDARAVSEGLADYHEFLSITRHRDPTVENNLVERARLFRERRAEVEAHNARPGTSWEAEVNKFADYTDDERQALLGHKPGRRHLGDADDGADAGASSFLEVGPLIRAQAPRHATLAASLDWRQKTGGAANYFRDQGKCGSCWAVAATGALETHLQLTHGRSKRLSVDQIVDCTPNPRHCGGTGGCQGATAELAFQYVQEHGLATESDYAGAPGGTCQPPSRVFAQTAGFNRLPVNKYEPLLRAVATRGPVVVSVDASKWFMYSRGVFNGCGKDAVVNHAVLMMGYGADEEAGKKFFLIRNSWSPSWGEDGHIRLERFEHSGYCGTDRKPEEGTGCDGGPKEIPVCGMCGVLSDSVYPTGLSVGDADDGVSFSDYNVP